MHHRGASQADLLGELLVRRLRQMRTVGEQERRDDPLAAVPFLDESDALLVAVDVVPIERHPLIGQELLRSTAVGAPAGAVELDLGHAATPSFGSSERSGSGGIPRYARSRARGRWIHVQIGER